MTDERTERTEEIRRKLEDPKVPFEAIFPARVWTPPSVDPDEGVAHFAADDLPSPHGGTELRSYLLSCAHGSTQVTLETHTRPHTDARDEEDGVVLRNLLERLRTHAAESGVTCRCWPKGWMAA